MRDFMGAIQIGIPITWCKIVLSLRRTLTALLLISLITIFTKYLGTYT